MSGIWLFWILYFLSRQLMHFSVKITGFQRFLIFFSCMIKVIKWLGWVAYVIVIMVTGSILKFRFETLDSFFGIRLWTQDLRLRTWNFGLRLVNWVVRWVFSSEGYRINYLGLKWSALKWRQQHTPLLNEQNDKICDWRSGILVHIVQTARQVLMSSVRPFVRHDACECVCSL